ncbi:MAG: NADP-dependent oxidoreductase [Bacteroidetes bacterium]|jgi:NADPH:quinone reductase-like Zn-dependent oxidoreductase|nr:NADP-dependent oxidoreductase [Bacteroidota bacterium]
MKALQIVKYGKIEDSMAFTEVNKPSIQDNDLLIEVKAAAINPIDKHIILGDLQGMLPIPLPAIPAYDVSGLVVAKGKSVSQFNIGDAIYTRVPQEQMGTITEFVSAASEAVSHKPKNTTFEEAASIPLAGLTAMQTLEYARIKENDKVLIHAGSGGVGSLAIQYAKAKGAYVYTTTSTSNVDWVKELGADRVIDYKTEDYKAIVKDVDIVFDTLGQQYTIEAFELIKHGGKVVSVKGALDEETANLFGIPNYTLPEELAQLINAKQATYKYVFMHPNGAHLNEIKTMIESKLIKPIIDKVYPFEQSIDAFTHLASGRAKGKIVITLNK